jgi:hypothetical protein
VTELLAGDRGAHGGDRRGVRTYIVNLVEIGDESTLTTLNDEALPGPGDRRYFVQGGDAFTWQDVWRKVRMWMARRTDPEPFIVGLLLAADPGVKVNLAPEKSGPPAHTQRDRGRKERSPGA